MVHLYGAGGTTGSSALIPRTAAVLVPSTAFPLMAYSYTASIATAVIAVNARGRY